jgi:hypothetical protein
MFMVVLGVVFQQNFVSMSQADVSMEDFIFVFIFLLFWFVFSFNIASGLSGVSAGIAKAAAAFPGWFLKKTAGFFLKRFGIPSRVGGAVTKVGDFIEKKFGKLPILGWEIRRLGKTIQRLGNRIMEQDVMAQRKEFVMEDIKELWKNFVNNPSDETWNNFWREFRWIAKNELFKEEVEKFGSKIDAAALGRILRFDRRNEFFDIGPIKDKLEERYNKIVTAFTKPKDRVGQDAFIEFLRKTDAGTVADIFREIEQERMNTINQLLRDTGDRFITDVNILRKLAEVSQSIYQPGANWTHTPATWMLTNRGRFPVDRRLNERLNALRLLLSQQPQPQGGGEQGGGEQGGGEQGGGEQGGGEQGGGEQGGGEQGGHRRRGPHTAGPRRIRPSGGPRP